METVAKAREEKNVSELRAERSEELRLKAEVVRLEAIITYHLDQMKEHEVALKECIELKWYTSLAAIGLRIEQTGLALNRVNTELNDVRVKMV
jgi:hypothetical protein